MLAVRAFGESSAGSRRRIHRVRPLSWRPLSFSFGFTVGRSDITFGCGVAFAISWLGIQGNATSNPERPNCQDHGQNGESADCPARYVSCTIRFWPIGHHIAPMRHDRLRACPDIRSRQRLAVQTRNPNRDGCHPVRKLQRPALLCHRLATTNLFLLRNRAFRFTSDAKWP
jgi:hypothetical protein